MKKKREKRINRMNNVPIYYMVLVADNIEIHYFRVRFLTEMIIMDTVLCARYFYVSCMELNKWTTTQPYHTIGIFRHFLSRSHSNAHATLTHKLYVFVYVIIYELFLFCRCDKCKIK